jgi:ubiquinone/menaquinone biosynthesis C-methylase UbiE/DNA-binding transcriptional ArsR family regulator
MAANALLPLDPLLAALRAAGEETRLRLLALLLLGDLTVSDLTDILGQSQPRISRHLKLLHEAGLVDRYREGAYVFYALARDGAEGALGQALTGFLDRGDGMIQRDVERLKAVRAARDAAAADYFRAVAADWDRIRSLHVAEGEVESAIRACIGGEPIEAHLDIGTGTGRLVEMIAPQTRRSVGIDLSHDMLAVARANLGRGSHRHVQVRPGDVYALPFEDKAFDLVTVHQVLHYLEEPARAVAEAARVLKPGGRLLVVDFAPHELEFLRAEHAHRRLGFSTEQMRQWLGAAGLDLTDTRHLAGEGDGNQLTVTLWFARAAGEPRSLIGVAA